MTRGNSSCRTRDNLHEMEASRTVRRTRLKYVAKSVRLMHPSEHGRGRKLDCDVRIESAEEMGAELESLVTRIETAKGLIKSPNVSPSEKSDLERARAELVALLDFKTNVLRSSLDRLGEERGRSERMVSFLERELGRERAMLAIEKESNEDKEREFEAQLRISRLGKELVLQQSRAKAIGEAVDLLKPVLEKAAIATELAPAK